MNLTTKDRKRLINKYVTQLREYIESGKKEGFSSGIGGICDDSVWDLENRIRFLQSEIM